MTYFERRYASKFGGGSVDKLGREGRVLCDRCGFGTHHRPSRDDDRDIIRVEDCPGWSWDPQGEWCWDRRWSSEPHPCDICGRDANIGIPLYVIADELERIHALSQLTADGRAFAGALATFNLIAIMGAK